MDNSDTFKPFGVLFKAPNPTDSVLNVPPHAIRNALKHDKLVVLRGFAPLDDGSFIQFASQFGPLLKWEFGEIFTVETRRNPDNHLFRNGRVEMHWDGAYLREAPRYSVFQCMESSSPSGGETIFTDTVKLLENLPEPDRVSWERAHITYETDKKAHYSGRVTVPLVSTDKWSGARVIRFIEPFNEDNMDINPVYVHVAGLDAAKQRAFLTSVTKTLYGSDVMYRHPWQKGDFLIYDNATLLHGRNCLKENVSRKLKRIHIMEDKGSTAPVTPEFITVRDRDVHL